MARSARLNVPGALYHVMTRGIEKGVIFTSDADRGDMVRRLEDGLGRHACGCLAWALMPNHIHLLLRAGPRGISPFMSGLLGGYATAYNLRHRRVGYLFANRFKSKLCDTQEYFLNLARYIHLNPLRAGLVGDLGELAGYRWCGHGALYGAACVPWQDTAGLLEHFGEDPLLARRSYLDFVGVDAASQKPWRPPEEPRGRRPRSGAGDVSILGNEAFLRKVLAGPGRAEESLSLNVSARQVLAFCAEEFGAVLSDLGVPRGNKAVSTARAAAAFLCVRHLGLRGVDLTGMLAMGESAVSAAVRRGQRLAEERGLFQALKARCSRLN